MIGNRDCRCPLLRFARESQRLLGDAYDSDGGNELVALTVASLRQEHGCRGLNYLGDCAWAPVTSQNFLRVRNDVPLLNRERYEKKPGQYL